MKIRNWVGAAVLMVAGLASAQEPIPQPIAPAPAAVTGWTISFSWSPEFCKRNLGIKEMQCLQENYFVLSGLAPGFAGEGPACDRESLPRELFPRALDVVHNEARLKKIWRQQGGCSGLAAGEYVLQLERAGRRISVPDRFRSTPREGLQLSQAEFKDAFLRDNPGLRADAITLQCRGAWLESASFCVDAGFGFQACPQALTEGCAEPLRLRAIRPALRSDRGE